MVLGVGSILVQASTLWLQALEEVCDSFLQLCMKEISYVLENQSTGCHEDDVTLHMMKEFVGALGSQLSESKGRIFEVLSKNRHNVLY